MCYFLLVGTTPQPVAAAAWGALEDRFALPIDRTVARASARSFFPADDTVWVITHRGCSCDFLLGARQSDGTVQFSRQARQGIAQLARDAGALRLYVRGRQVLPSARPPRVTMTIDELLDPAAPILANCLVELIANVPSSHLN